MSDYNSRHKGLSIDDTVSNARIFVPTLTDLANIDTSNGRVVVGKIADVGDDGTGKSASYVWTGSVWNILNIDTVNVADQGVLKTENEKVVLVFNDSGDDAGVRVTEGQFTVENSEIIAGKDSYPVPIAFQYNTSTEVGGVISSAVNVTSQLQSDEGSIIDLFADNLAGDVILVGSTEPFYGAKFKFDSVGDINPDELTMEFYNTSDEWQKVTFMTTESVMPYNSIGNTLGYSLTEHLRSSYPLDPDYVTVWGLRTLNINGINYTRYWGRFRLISPLGIMPVVEQIKLHPSRIELNSSGIQEFFGLSRGCVTLQSGVRTFVENTTSSPLSQAVGYFQSTINGDVIAGYLENKFSNSAVDGVIIVQPYCPYLDTSTPLLLEVSYYVDGIQTGDVELSVEYKVFGDGFVYNQSIQPDGVISVIDSVITPSSQIRRTVRFEIPVDSLTTEGGGGVVIHLVRDATPANLDDTLAQDVVITNFSLVGRRWRV